MKMQLLKQTFASILLIVLTNACNKSSSTPDPITPEIPGVPVGILPANAETCSDFEEVPGATNKATIFFSWSKAENATGYLVQLFESETEVHSLALTATEAEFVLDKGKLYSWMVIAENSAGSTPSSTMSFTTPGEAIGNYAPYAAEISAEYDNNTSEITISWIGSDEDGDPLTYDIQVRDAEDILIVDETGLDESTMNPISVSPGELYTIKVTSKDDFGNFSISTSTVRASD